MQLLPIKWGKRTAVLVVCAVLSSGAFAEVLHGELRVSFDWLNLETGVSFENCFGRRCSPIPREYDFRFLLNGDLPVLSHNTDTPAVVRRIAIFDEQPFNAIGFADIETATFSTNASDFPLEPDDTVILQTDTGAYFRIGNIILRDVSTLKYDFDYEELTGEVDAGRVFEDGFESPQ